MNGKNKASMFVYDIASVVVTGIIVIAFIFTFMFRTAGVVGWSMFPTLNNGDVLAVSAHYSDVKNGDIIIITQPNAFNEPIVKRIIATEGQTVDIDFDKGIVYVDDVALDEPYISELTRDREDFAGKITVPEGHVFVMGDNRNDSTDSRSEMVGFIDVRYIYGKALGRLTPAGQWQIYDGGQNGN